MLSLRVRIFSLVCAVVLWPALTSSIVETISASKILTDDDECTAGDADCSMNALQMKARIGQSNTTTAAPAAKSSKPIPQDTNESKDADDKVTKAMKKGTKAAKQDKHTHDLKARKEEQTSGDNENEQYAEGDEAAADRKQEQEEEKEYQEGLEEEFQEMMLDAECPLIAREGSNCYNAVKYVANTAIKEHPDWFPGLTPDAEFVDFQRALFKMNQGDCLDPCPRPLKYCSPRAVRRDADQMDRDACLCVFDVDRTLTGSQGDTTQCAADTLVPGIYDDAYDKGNFTASGLGAAGVHKTFCRHCFKSIVTAGDVNGMHSKERQYIQYHTLADDIPSWQARFMDKLGWSAATVPWTLGDVNITSVTSPYVYLQKDGTKQHAVDAIVNWYRLNNVYLDCRNVYFFDDRFSNVAPFEVTPFNAKQISCSARDPKHPGVGLCGATVTEISDRFDGVKLCKPY